MADASGSNSGPAGPGHGLGQQPQRQAQGGGFLQQILQYFMMYLLITNVSTFFKSKPSSVINDGPNAENSEGMTRIEKPTEVQTAIMGVSPQANLPVFPTRDAEGRKLGTQKCLFKKDMTLDFYLFITDDKYFNYAQDIEKMVGISIVWFSHSLVRCAGYSL